MIAPLQPETLRPDRPSPLGRARRLVLHTLLVPQHHSPGRRSAFPAWRAWLFAGWVVAVTALYGVMMAMSY